MTSENGAGAQSLHPQSATPRVLQDSQGALPSSLDRQFDGPTGKGIIEERPTKIKCLVLILSVLLPLPLARCLIDPNLLRFIHFWRHSDAQELPSRVLYMLCQQIHV
ncbi:hypothetical protein VTO42DRAFT_2871 [Malbranchea cinnamomea]